ncbi:hypothetical protein CXB51_028641 [Gossypium anomalum]|uniref:Uncharacterized protein n=1 Tax=Gossypium anomalum TaxID=47600 RepID=A0A8J5YHA1_9ROSI|nr:hypothetical protein CXB51_028641 [Gossypium anomalum]
MKHYHSHPLITLHLFHFNLYKDCTIYHTPTRSFTAFEPMSPI